MTVFFVFFTSLSQCNIQQIVNTQSGRRGSNWDQHSNDGIYIWFLSLDFSCLRLSNGLDLARMVLIIKGVKEIRMGQKPKMRVCFQSNCMQFLPLNSFEAILSWKFNIMCIAVSFSKIWMVKMRQSPKFQMFKVRFWRWFSFDSW